jgi:tRNA(Ile)-lysidine synthase
LVSNGFWHIVSVVKEQDLPVMQKGYIQLGKYLRGPADCQQQITDFHSDAQHTGKSLCGGRIRVLGRKLARNFLTMQKKQNAKKASSGRSPVLTRGVLAALRRLEVWRPGAKFGVAVSGGADSVALLRLFIELRNDLQAEAPIEIAVVHFNHQLRGEAADADEKFVRELAEEHGLDFHLGSADVGASAKRAKRNVEDAGRRERYAFFARLVQEGRVEWVATAHTMDDQAETVLAHILRGTGLTGLGGIHPLTAGIVRPVLGMRRAELRQYLKLRKQSWREDATNRDTSKTRARIRGKLVPLLEKHFQPEVVSHLAALAARAREDEDFLDGAAAAQLARTLRDAPDALRIGTADLVGRATPPALSGRMARRIVKACKGRDGELGAIHVASILQLARSGENGKSMAVPGGVEVRRERDTLLFRAAGNSRDAVKAIEYEHEVATHVADVAVNIPPLKCVFRFRTIDWVRQRSETSDTWAAVDCSKLKSPLTLRNWRPGDRLQPTGRGSIHKLKRLLNEKGVSRWDRNGWPVLLSDGEIIWARGFGEAAKYAASDETRTALVIEEEPL